MLRRHNLIGLSILIVSGQVPLLKSGRNTHERTTRMQGRFTGGEKGRGEAPTPPSAQPFLLLRQLSLCVSGTVQCCVVLLLSLFGLAGFASFASRAGVYRGMSVSRTCTFRSS